MPTLYSPGTTPVAVTARGVVVLESGTSPALASRIRDLVADGRGLGGVIEALTGAYGASLSAIPAFAVALAEGSSVRVAVRGSLVLEVEAARTDRVSGEGVTTWTERVVDAVTRVALSATAAAAADGAPVEYPVEDGVVLADRVVWEPGAASDGDAPGSSREKTPNAVAAAPGTAPGAPARERPAPQGEQAPVAGQSPTAPDATAAPAGEPALTPADEPSVDETIASSRRPQRAPSAPAVPSAPPASPVPSAPAVPPAPPTGLIDSSAVLSVAGADTLLPGDSTFIPRAEPQPETPATDPLAATVVRPTVPSAAAPAQGDHDGETVSVAQARAMRTGDPLTSSMPPLAPPRPRAPGRIRVSTGQIVTLDRTVVIGRRPRSTRVSGTDLPHLIAVDSPQQDISRSHVELRVEGDSIVATDLRTTNGTTLRRTGTDPVRLHPGEGTVVVPGDVLDLGDGITVAIEELV
jgi:hypothetical protein